MKTLTNTAAERGTIFSGESIRLILKRKKTMTRRVMGLREYRWWAAGGWEKDDLGWPMGADEYGDYARVRCPFSVGQRLYVREAAFLRAVTVKKDKTIRDFDLVYDADETIRTFQRSDYEPYKHTGSTSPIFMPRWAARIVLEVTEVWPEKLWAMSTADAVREGMDAHCDPDLPSAVDQFKVGWDRINGRKHPWKDSEGLLVWVIAFKLLEGRADVR